MFERISTMRSRLRWGKIWAYGIAQDVRRELSPAEFIGGYPTPQGADGISLGLGCWSWRRSFTPASLAPKWWNDPTNLVDRTYAPSDGDDFEAGVAGWSTLGDASVSSESGTRTGGSGSLVGRLTVGTTGTSAYDALAIVGNRFLVDAWGKRYTAGTAPKISCPGGPITGAYVDGWQELQAEGDAISVNVYLQASVSSAGDVVDFDDLTLTNLSLVSLDPSAGSSLTGSFANATAAQQPYEDNSDSKWMVFDGTSDNSVYDGSAADFTFMHYSAVNPGNYPSFEFEIGVELDAVPANRHTVFATGNAPGLLLFVMADGSIRVSCLATSGASLAQADSVAGAMVVGVPATIRVKADGVNLKVFMDGVEVATAAFAGTPGSGAPSGSPTFGKYSTYYLQGKLAAPVFVDGNLSAAQSENLWTWHSTELSIP